jgi:hypothetical protein
VSDTRQTELSDHHPFVSEQAKYIFILTKMDGKQRCNALGITDSHYEDKTVAATWYQKIWNIIKDDPDSDNAKYNLDSIYWLLIDY